MYSCVLCRPAGMCVGGDIEIKVWLHMIFVQNFTQPGFQAKSFTPQKCVILPQFFLQINSVNASNINNLWHFLVINELFSSMSTVLEMKSG